MKPIEKPVTPTSNSQNYSLCALIEEQHKLHRTPAARQSAVFPFREFYIENFSAAEELEKIDRISDANTDVPDENEGFFFSLEYNALPSSYKLHTETIQAKDQRMMTMQPVKTINKTPLTLNEHKYSKQSYFTKQHQSPQLFAAGPSATCYQSSSKADYQSSPKAVYQSSLKVDYQSSSKTDYQSSTNVDYQSSLKAGQQTVPRLFMPSLYNYSKESRNTTDHLTNRNEDWFESSRRPQQKPTASVFSQMGYGSQSLEEGFTPSQSRFHW